MSEFDDRQNEKIGDLWGDLLYYYPSMEEGRSML